jgi:hypothetical protein
MRLADADGGAARPPTATAAAASAVTANTFTFVMLPPLVVASAYVTHDAEEGRLLPRQRGGGGRRPLDASPRTSVKPSTVRGSTPSRAAPDSMLAWHRRPIRASAFFGPIPAAIMVG